MDTTIYQCVLCGEIRERGENGDWSLCPCLYESDPEPLEAILDELKEVKEVLEELRAMIGK